LALTTVTFDAATGAILDVDMEFNTAESQFVPSDPQGDQIDFLTVATHQFGHFLGLSHSKDPTATMAPSYTPASIDKRDLAPDDTAAICAVYQPDGKRSTAAGLVQAEPCQGGPSQPCPPSTTAGCSLAPASGASDGRLGLGALFAAAGVLCWARRRRAPR
jgi:hypothetical protein